MPFKRTLNEIVVVWLLIETILTKLLHICSMAYNVVSSLFKD